MNSRYLALISVLAVLSVLIVSSEACGIWGQVFCDYCWDGRYTGGKDYKLSGASVFANCSVTTYQGSVVHYWGSGSTDSNGYFQAGLSGASNNLGTGNADSSFLKGLFVNSDYHQGQRQGTRVENCKITVSNAGKCSLLSLHDGNFLTSGGEGNGYTSSNVFISQYASNSPAADIYIGSGGSRDNSVSCRPPSRPSDCPGASPPPPGSKGDPHFTGADSSHFDFTGHPGNSYCLISDSHIHVNAYYGGRYDRWGDNPHKPLTWMRKVGLLWGSHSIVLQAREGSKWKYGDGYMASIQVDGQEVKLAQAGDSASFADGRLEISWLAARMMSADDEVDVYLVKIEGVIMLRLTLRPEVALLRTPTDGVVHFDLDLPLAQLSDSAHGVLGQTFRADHRFRLSMQKLEYSELLHTKVVPGDNADGFLDGSVDDYRTSSLMAADCKFSVFDGKASRSTSVAPAVQLASSSATSILGLNRKMLKMVV